MKKITQKISLLTLSAGSMLASAQSVLAQGAIDFGADVDPQTGYADNIATFINAILTFVMLIAALLVFLYLIWGGIEWITSGGDKGKTESARNKITAAVIGLVVLAASYAILQVALQFLGFEQGLTTIFTGNTIQTISN